MDLQDYADCHKVGQYKLYHLFLFFITYALVVMPEYAYLLAILMTKTLEQPMRHQSHDHHPYMF